MTNPNGFHRTFSDGASQALGVHSSPAVSAAGKIVVTGPQADASSVYDPGNFTAGVDAKVIVAGVEGKASVETPGGSISGSGYANGPSAGARAGIGQHTGATAEASAASAGGAVALDVGGIQTGAGIDVGLKVGLGLDVGNSTKLTLPGISIEIPTPGLGEVGKLIGGVFGGGQPGAEGVPGGVPGGWDGKVGGFDTGLGGGGASGRIPGVGHGPEGSGYGGGGYGGSSTPGQTGGGSSAKYGSESNGGGRDGGGVDISGRGDRGDSGGKEPASPGGGSPTEKGGIDLKVGVAGDGQTRTGEFWATDKDGHTSGGKVEKSDDGKTVTVVEAKRDEAPKVEESQDDDGPKPGDDDARPNDFDNGTGRGLGPAGPRANDQFGEVVSQHAGGAASDKFRPADDGTGPTGPNVNQGLGDRAAGNLADRVMPADDGTGPTGPNSNQGLAGRLMPQDDGTGPTGPNARELLTNEAPGSLSYLGNSGGQSLRSGEMSEFDRLGTLDLDSAADLAAVMPAKLGEDHLRADSAAAKGFATPADSAGAHNLVAAAMVNPETVPLGGTFISLAEGGMELPPESSFESILAGTQAIDIGDTQSNVDTLRESLADLKSSSNLSVFGDVSASSRAAGDEVSLNPQPLPPKEIGSLFEQGEAGRFGDAVSLNPQPLPPKEIGPLFEQGSAGRIGDAVSLNPQPLPPSETRVGDLMDQSPRMYLDQLGTMDLGSTQAETSPLDSQFDGALSAQTPILDQQSFMALDPVGDAGMAQAMDFSSQQNAVTSYLDQSESSASSQLSHASDGMYSSSLMAAMNG